MTSFSERHNLLPKSPLQTNSLDEKSRNMFYNLLDYIIKLDLSLSNEDFKKDIWQDFFLEIQFDKFRFRDFFYKWFYESQWHSIFDLVEWIYSYRIQNNYDLKKWFNESTNNILVKNNIGYSFIDGNFIPITNETEIRSIQETMGNGFENVETHFNNAIQLFSDRENPDYTNCIKECICAVEAKLMIVLGVTKGTVGEMVKILSNQNKLPEPLKEGWSKMYGYTSNYGGVRHGKSDDDEIEIDFHHAKYFLVISSAFINYLKSLK
jgi:hypothetical protein